VQVCAIAVPPSVPPPLSVVVVPPLSVVVVPPLSFVVVVPPSCEVLGVELEHPSQVLAVAAEHSARNVSP
jgi:hypothetical protein